MGDRSIGRCAFRTSRLEVGEWHALAESHGIDLAATLVTILTERATRALPPDWHGPFTMARAGSLIADRDRESPTLLAVDEATARPLGIVLLFETPASAGRGCDLRIGYVLAEAAWGRRLGTELIGGLVAWARRDPGIRSLIAGVEADHDASARVLLKNRFIETTGPGDERRFHLPLNGPEQRRGLRATDDPIVTDRLALHVLDAPLIELLLEMPTAIDRFRVPAGHPDDDLRHHLERWWRLAFDDGGYSPWRARALVDRERRFVGHAGFHAPPVTVEAALADETFEGRIDPCERGVVEVGYTLFEPFRSSGYATEATAGLIDWAAATGEVGAVLATVRTDNAPSRAVLERVGGFVEIGRCRDDGEEEIVLRRDL